MTPPPKDLTERPAMTPMDVVSDVLATLRLTGEVLFTTRFGAPFAVSSPSGDRVGPAIMPGARCFAAFHIVIRSGLALAAVAAGAAGQFVSNVEWPIVGTLEPSRLVLLCSGLLVLLSASRVRMPREAR